MKALAKSLVRKLQEKPSGSVVSMAEFVLDYRVSVKIPIDEFLHRVLQGFEQGAANITDVEIEPLLGGCAANVASCLSNMGAQTVLFAKTSPIGSLLLSHFLGSRVKTFVEVGAADSGNWNCTLELFRPRENSQSKLPHNVSIMLGSIGSVFSQLTPEMEGALEEARAVGIFSYMYTIRRKVVQEVLELVERKGTFTLLTTQDPTGHRKEFPGLFRLLRRGLVRRLSLNENEVKQYARYAAKREIDDPRKCAILLSKDLGLDLDLHTERYSFSVIDGKEYLVPCFELKVNRLLGAGDCWDAADLYGELIGLGHEERLLFSNAVAGCYISKAQSIHPTINEVIDFMRTHHQLDDSGHSDLFFPRM